MDSVQHLEPEEGLFSAHSEMTLQEQYHALLRVAFLDAYPNRACQMLSVPSRRPERAVYVACLNGEIRIVARTASVNLWNAYMWQEDDAGRPFAPPLDLDAVRPRLRRSVAETSAAISSDTFSLLDDIWNAMLMGVRPALGGGGLDGERYHFANRQLSGQKYHPSTESLPGRLVGVADTMIQLAEAAGAARLQNDLVIETKRVLTSVKRVRARPWGQLTCR